MAYYGGTTGNIQDEGTSRSGSPVVLMETTSGYVVLRDHKIVYGPTSSQSAARKAYEDNKRA